MPGDVWNFDVFDKRENEIDIIRFCLFLLFVFVQLSFVAHFLRCPICVFSLTYSTNRSRWKWRQEQFFLLLCSFCKVRRIDILLTFYDRYMDYKSREKTGKHRHRMGTFRNSNNIINVTKLAIFLLIVSLPRERKNVGRNQGTERRMLTVYKINYLSVVLNNKMEWYCPKVTRKKQ